MADKYWLDTDGDLSNTANWSGGSLPSGTDNIFFEKVTKPIVSNLSALSSNNPAILRFGPGVKAPIGTESNPFRINTCTGEASFDIPQSSGVNVRCGAWTKTIIKNTSQVTNALNIIGDTITAMYVAKAPFLNLGSSVVLTLGEFFAQGRNPSNIYCHIAPNATITTITNRCGNIDCETSCGTINHDDGIFDMKGSTSGSNNITTSLTINGSGEFRRTGLVASTYTFVKVIKGVFKSMVSGYLLTIIDSEVNEGGAIYCNSSYTNATNPLIQKGGIVQGVNKTVIFETMGM